MDKSTSKIVELIECEICGKLTKRPHRHNHYSLDLATVKGQLWAIILLLVLLAIIGMVTCEHAKNVADAVR